MSSTSYRFHRIICSLVVLALVVSASGFPLAAPSVQAASLADASAKPVDVVKEAQPSVTATFASPIATPLPPTPVPTPTVVPAPTIAPVPLPLFTPTLTVTQQIIAPMGGRLLSTDKRIQLDVPPGLFKNSTQLKITPRIVKADSDPGWMMMRFDLDAQDLQTNARISKFDQPITLTIDLRGLVSWANTPRDTRLVIMTASDISGTEWSEVPGTSMSEYGLMTVPLKHFSQYASGFMAQGWQLMYNAPAVDLFSGAGTYNYPIDVPAGRNGFTPKVNLSYNSRRVDGLLNPGWNTQKPLGMGWSIDQIDILREGVGSSIIWCDTQCRIVFPDSFSLLINGTGYHLVPDVAGQSSGSYHAQDAPWLKILRVNPTYNNSPYPPNDGGEYWLVWLADGTVIRLGYTYNSEQRRVDGYVPYCPAYCGIQGVAGYRWRADVMTDTLGNTMQFTYLEDETHGDGKQIGLSRLASISYNNKTLPGAASPQYTTQIVFANDPGANTQEINQIQVWNAGQLARQYHISIADYGDVQGSPDECGQYVSMREVTAIQQQDASGNGLPATTFTYSRYKHAKNGADCAHYWYLTNVNNGYGASTNFNYVSDGRWQGCWPQPNGSCNDKDSIGFSYYITQVLTYDGRSSTPAKVTYDDAQPCYDQTGANGQPCRSNSFSDPTGALAGFGTVTQIVYAYDNSVINRSVHTFDINNTLSPLRGRELQAQTYDASSTLLTQVNNTYTTSVVAATTFTYLSQQDTTTYSGATAVTQRVQYTDDLYGNQIEQIEYDVNLQPYRRTSSTFYPNLTKWIVNKSGYQNVDQVFGGLPSYCTTGYSVSHNVGWCLVSSVWHTYDNNPRFDVAPTTGLLTAERHWRGNIDSGGYNYVDTRYAYDAWGNPSTETTYDDFGNGGNFAQLNPKTITTTYEGSYHLYPVQVTNAKSQSTQVGYNYTLGVPTTVTDPNGAVTTQNYDSFGRLSEVYKPGDAAGDPSTKYSYYDTGSPLFLSPFVILEWHKPASIKASVRHFYDGLGREIQTHTAYSVTLSGYSAAQDILVSRQFDARGLVVSETVPYAVPAYTAWPSNPYTTVNLVSAPKTLTQYDALGRAKLVTAPDGTTTNHYYALDVDSTFGYPLTYQWLHSTKDANGHAKHYVQDALGRLVIVRDFTGTCYSGPGCYDAYALYAATTYNYDVLGNLTGVTDAANNSTTMVYNLLGQKTDMYDPDMGHWLYQYDKAGNLTVQDDAKHQRSCFYYDQLNRLLGKYYTNDTTTCATTNPPYVVTYTYDAYDGVTQFGRGRRTSMSMTDNSSSASWTYDIRGRVTNEAKTIAGTTYNTGYGYDTLDRVTSITYPNSTREVVQQTYDLASRLLSVSGAANYASGFQYNALTQLKQTTLGNGAVTSYAYYGDGGPAVNSFRLWQINTNKSGNLLNLQYTYDNVGNVRFINNTLAGENIQYQYDALDRLLNAGTPINESYQYTSIGNIYTKTGLGTYTYATGCSGGTSHAIPHAVASTTTGGNSYTYDCNGNMTNRTENNVPYTQGWDWENRLQTVSGNSQLTTYTYDGDGNRVKKVDTTGTTIYVGNYWEQFTPAQSGTNLAQGKTATQSSTLSSHAASMAVDGNTNGSWYNNSVTATNNDVHAWWQVDLNRVQPIQSITLWNRTDCCGDRLSNFYVLVSDNPITSTDLTTARNQAGVSSYYIASVGTNTSVTVNRTGQYVRVQLAGTNYLSLAEVQVWSGPLQTSYYYAGSTRIAMRQGNALYYFAGDHLGSASLTMDTSGNKTAELRYKPFGETRAPSGVTPTDRRFTGQRSEEATLGSLYDYGARFYSPVLGRFLSADTIVPGAGNPQAFNRYAYVTNNPLKYIDPTGHIECNSGGCDASGGGHRTPQSPPPPPAASTTPANQAPSGNYWQQAAPASINNPTNGVVIVVSLNTNWFFREEVGYGTESVMRVAFHQANFDGTFDNGWETDYGGDVGPVGITQVYGDDGKQGTQFSVQTPGPIHLTAQSQGNTIQGGIEAESTGNGPRVRGAILTGLDIGYDKAVFLTSKGYFDNIGGGEGFLNRYTPRAKIVSTLTVQGAPYQITSRGCMPGITGYQRMLNMFSGRIVP